MGVGGSGKQSLTRLAAYVSGLEVFQIQLRKGYSIADLKVHTTLCTSPCQPLVSRAGHVLLNVAPTLLVL